MTAIHALDRERHGSLRLDPLRGAAARRLVQVGLSEIALTAADMPLCLAKDAHTGRFNLIALMGLVEPTNLFGQHGAINATYIPRAAMLTAFRRDEKSSFGLAIDEADPALGAQGELLFDHAGATAMVARLRADLDDLITDLAATQAVVDDYARLRLIRPLTIDVRFQDGAKHRIDGLYTVNNAALAALDDPTVVSLHRQNRLAPAAILAASLMQIERLRQLHNASGYSAIESIALEVADE